MRTPARRRRGWEERIGIGIGKVFGGRGGAGGCERGGYDRVGEGVDCVYGMDGCRSGAAVLVLESGAPGGLVV